MIIVVSNSLTFAAGSMLDVDFGAAGPTHTAPGSSDTIAVTGGAGSLVFPSSGAITLNLASGSGNFTGTTGIYELFSYTDSAAVSNFTAGDGTSGSILLGTGFDAISDATYDIYHVNDTSAHGIFLKYTRDTGPNYGHGTWSSTGNNWSDSSNWNGSVPGVAGNIATFNGGGLTTVNVDGSQTVGSIVLSGTTGYTISGSSTITMDNGTSNASINSTSPVAQTISSQVNVGSTKTLDVSSSTAALMLASINNAGTLNVSGIVYLGNVTSNGTLNLGSSTMGVGTITLNGGTLGGSGNAGEVAAGSAAHAINPSLDSGTSTTLTMASLTTNSDTTIKIHLGASNSGSSDMINVTGTLDISDGVTLDTTDHELGGSLGWFKVMQYGTLAGTLSNITVPANDDIATTGIRYVLSTSSDISGNFVNLHRGFTGDTDDSGTVDLTDLTLLAANWQKTGMSWGQGDFDNSGLVDLTDLTLLASKWQQSPVSSGVLDSLNDSESWQSAIASVALGNMVPEPSALALLGLVALGLLGRRRAGRGRRGP